MKTIKSLLLVFACFISVLKAQQPLWHISLLAEETLNEVGQDKIQTAWFVTGRDTVYTIHLQDSKIVGRATPYDFDTIWTEGDSLYQRHIDYLRDTEELAAYNGRKNVVVSEYAYGKRKKRTITRYGEDWKPDYEKVQTIEGISILERQGLNKLFFTLINFKDSSRTYTQKHLDTTVTWLIRRGDTITITNEWKNYKEEEFHFSQGRTYTSLKMGDTTIHISSKSQSSDSIFTIKSEIVNLNEYYSKKGFEDYRHTNTFKAQWKKGKYYQYEYRWASDTSRYVWRYYQNGGDQELGILPKISKQVEYDKDSIINRETDFVYNDNGGLTTLNIKTGEGLKTVVNYLLEMEPPEPPEERPLLQIHDVDPPQQEIRVANDILSKVVSSNLNLSQTLVNNIGFTHSMYVDLKFEEWWHETIIIEIGADKTISGVSRSPSSELWVEGFLMKTKDEELKIPKKLKTVLYYIDVNGKKQKQKLDFILLPVELNARTE